MLLVWSYRLYPSLLDAIIIVQPETVIRWHRHCFRAYWRWKSRHVGGRPRTDSGIRALIRRTNRENPLWGAPRIHGELLMLGIEVAESTVGRYMVRRRGPPSQGWNWHGLAIEHVVTGSVRDSAAVLDAIAGNMPGDPYSAPPQHRPFIQETDANLGRLRIGLMKRSPRGGAPLHPDCVAAVEDVAKLLQSLGHSVEESHPAALDEHEHIHHFGVVVNCHTVLALAARRSGRQKDFPRRRRNVDLDDGRARAERVGKCILGFDTLVTSLD